MLTRSLLLLTIALVTAAAQSPAPSAPHPRDREIHDADTRAWWHTTEDLSSDAMEGRDTGSAAYERAANYVADRFRKAGLQPAGDHGTFFQQVPLHQVEVTPEGTSFSLILPGGGSRPLAFLHQITVAATPNLPARLEAPLAFRGYCSKDEAVDLTGKIAVCFASRRAGKPSARDRIQAVRTAGAVGIVNVDDRAFTLEPPRWPEAYARSVTLAASPSADSPSATTPTPSSFATLRLNAAAFPALLEGSRQDADRILTLGGQSKPLPAFDLPGRLLMTTHTAQRDFTSPNVLAILPGTDPKLKSEYIVIAAHLDGYGHGTLVGGDDLYNGALDDAAYVALLIQFAEDEAARTRPAASTPATPVGLRRSILFCAFTGEEKGLLGSTWFTQHPTVPKASLAADINLDQLRPLFALKILTALAVDDSTLGETARNVAAPMNIEIRADREPERSLLTRADHYPFLQIGVPSIGFIFGYDPGTDAERRYREWYQVRYHRPQDDLTQPMDFNAATRFNSFFYKLTSTLANDPQRPAWSSGGPYRPR